MLKHHADAEPRAAPGCGDRDRAALASDLARVGLQRAIDDLTSVDLPAPFSPSSAWISPRAISKIDAVVRDDARRSAC